MKIETQVIHEKNLKLAKTILLSEGELLCSLMEMKSKRLFDDVGCTGIFKYCLDYLNFSESQAFYFQRIAEVARTVPELKEAVVKGELSVSKARRITKVITPQNQAQWIDNAKFMKQKELERAVSIGCPQELLPEGIKPIAQNISELRVAIDDETDTNLEILKNLLSQKLKRPATLSDVIRWAAKETRDKFDPEKKAERAGKKLSLGQSGPVGTHAAFNLSIELAARLYPLAQNTRSFKKEAFNARTATELDSAAKSESGWIPIAFCYSIMRFVSEK